MGYAKTSLSWMFFLLDVFCWISCLQEKMSSENCACVMVSSIWCYSITPVWRGFPYLQQFDPSRSVPGKMMFPTLCSGITALQPDPPRNPTPPGICTASLEPALLKKNSGQQDIATSREGALMAFICFYDLFVLIFSWHFLWLVFQPWSLTRAHRDRWVWWDILEVG